MDTRLDGMPAACNGQLLNLLAEEGKGALAVPSSVFHFAVCYEAATIGFQRGAFATIPGRGRGLETPGLSGNHRTARTGPQARSSQSGCPAGPGPRLWTALRLPFRRPLSGNGRSGFAAQNRNAGR